MNHLELASQPAFQPSEPFRSPTADRSPYVSAPARPLAQSSLGFHLGLVSPTPRRAERPLPEPLLSFLAGF